MLGESGGDLSQDNYMALNNMLSDFKEQQHYSKQMQDSYNKKLTWVQSNLDNVTPESLKHFMDFPNKGYKSNFETGLPELELIPEIVDWRGEYLKTKAPTKKYTGETIGEGDNEGYNVLTSSTKLDEEKTRQLTDDFAEIAFKRRNDIKTTKYSQAWKDTLADIGDNVDLYDNEEVDEKGMTELDRVVADNISNTLYEGQVANTSKQYSKTLQGQGSGTADDSDNVVELVDGEVVTDRGVTSTTNEYVITQPGGKDTPTSFNVTPKTIVSTDGSVNKNNTNSFNFTAQKISQIPVFSEDVSDYDMSYSAGSPISDEDYKRLEEKALTDQHAKDMLNKVQHKEYVLGVQKIKEIQTSESGDKKSVEVKNTVLIPLEEVDSDLKKNNSSYKERSSSKKEESDYIERIKKGKNSSTKTEDEM